MLDNNISIVFFGQVTIINGSRGQSGQQPTCKLAAALHCFYIPQSTYMLVEVLQIIHKGLDVNIKIGKVSKYSNITKQQKEDKATHYSYMPQKCLSVDACVGK